MRSVGRRGTNDKRVPVYGIGHKSMRTWKKLWQVMALSTATAASCLAGHLLDRNRRHAGNRPLWDVGLWLHRFDPPLPGQL
jgi:hypothetical protein